MGVAVLQGPDQAPLCVCRYRDQRDRPDLTNPDSLQLYLETRFEQLRVRAQRFCMCSVRSVTCLLQQRAADA